MSIETSKEIEKLNSKLCDSNTENNFLPLIKEINSLQSYHNSGNDIFLILKIKNKVLFPGLMLEITISKFQKKLINILGNFFNSNTPIGVILKESNTKEDIHECGSLAYIVDIKNKEGAKLHIVLRGAEKFQILPNDNYSSKEADYFVSKVNIIVEENKKLNSSNLEILKDSLKISTLELIQKDPECPSDAVEMVHNNINPFFLSYFAASITSMTPQERQCILKEANLKFKLENVLKCILKDIDLWKLRQSIKTKVYKGITKHQKEAFLRYELSILKNELGEDEFNDDISKYLLKCKNKKWPKKAKQHFENCIKKLERIPSSNPEYTTFLNHLDFFTDLPWAKYTKDNFDLKKAKNILCNSHFALKKPKERIYEYLAVLFLKKKIENSPILCFLGPPGVGKTSIGKSIAKALGKEYIRISLGAINDEADIRGHRKTYIGAMPGKPLNAIKQAGYSNPIILLDEIDKMSEYRGSPDAALLELLDPEQNKNFLDNFVEVHYDMSQVMFVATANSLENISSPLKDRMEIIEFEGYATEEKIFIAKDHIIPSQLEEHGLSNLHVNFTDKIIETIIDSYTCESGVRELKRKIATILRKIAKQIVTNITYNSMITTSDLHNYLGAEPFLKDRYEKFTRPGLAIGLAYTPYGGEILYIETLANKGKGEITISGQLGEVMKESAMAAMSYLKSYFKNLNIKQNIFEKYDFHIHVPDGATPKDGPSAGITLLVALASLLTGRKVKEKISMSGELTLRGIVLPVGGIKEKVLAAKRAGIKKIILSKFNEKDVKEIEKDYIKNLEFLYVSQVDEVLDIALNKQNDTNAYKFV